MYPSTLFRGQRFLVFQGLGVGMRTVWYVFLCHRFSICCVVAILHEFSGRSRRRGSRKLYMRPARALRLASATQRNYETARKLCGLPISHKCKLGHLPACQVCIHVLTDDCSYQNVEERIKAMNEELEEKMLELDKVSVCL